MYQDAITPYGGVAIADTNALRPAIKTLMALGRAKPAVGMHKSFTLASAEHGLLILNKQFY